MQEAWYRAAEGNWRCGYQYPVVLVAVHLNALGAGHQSQDGRTPSSAEMAHHRAHGFHIRFFLELEHAHQLVQRIVNSAHQRQPFHDAVNHELPAVLHAGGDDHTQ